MSLCTPERVAWSTKSSRRTTASSESLAFAREQSFPETEQGAVEVVGGVDVADPLVVGKEQSLEVADVVGEVAVTGVVPDRLLTGALDESTRDVDP